MKRSWPLLLVAIPATFLFLPRRPPAPQSPSLLPARPSPVPRSDMAASPLPGLPSPDSDVPADPPKPPPAGENPTPRWLVAQQNADGSWGDGPVAMEDGHRIGQTGLTSLALLALLGQGHTHLSRGEVGGSIKAGLQWLLARQEGKDGTFRGDGDPVVEQALASLALGETYGMTGTDLLKGPAAMGIEALFDSLDPRGGWGDPSTGTWCAMAVRTGEISELFDGHSPQVPLAAAVARGEFERSADPDRGLAYLLLCQRAKPSADLPRLLERIAGSGPAAGAPEFLRWYRDGVLMSQLPRQDPAWIRWSSDLKQALAFTRGDDGRWPGGTAGETILRTCLAELCTASLYRY